MRRESLKVHSRRDEKQAGEVTGRRGEKMRPPSLREPREALHEAFHSGHLDINLTSNITH